jgi:ATP-dependent RNA helicase DeaD
MEQPTPPTSTPNEFTALLELPALQAAVTRAGYTAPTPIQREAIPHGVLGKDLIIQAKTGSGKTVAFLIPLLQQLQELPDQKNTFALILTPTRELATQIVDVLKNLEPELDPVLLIGGMSMPQQRAAIAKDERVIVGTPGRTLDFLRQREISLKTVSFFVLDEADEMFSMGFYEDVTAILDHLPKAKGEKQGILVSATMSLRVQSLAQRYLREPVKVSVIAPEEQHASIEHTYLDVDGNVALKANTLCDLIEVEKPRSAIIFCNTKSDTELVEAFLRRRGFNARRINSDLAQKQRNAVMEKIRSGELRFLVGTDLAARGIDIDTIDLVVNYALPDVPEVYVHRSGRTGRAGRKGKSVSIVAPQDFPQFLTLKRTLQMEFKPQSAPTEAEVVAARQEHLLELLKNEERAVAERDIAQVRTLMSGTPLTPDVERQLAVMLRSYVESSVKAPSLSLDEELARELGGDSEPPRREYDDRRGPRSDHRGNGGGSRGGDRGRRGGRDSRR